MKNVNERYLRETAVLNFSAKNIQALIEKRGWRKLDDFHKIEGIYNFVRDEIRFGYNVGDYITAEQVLSDKMGQCNTKSTLLMALLRAVGIPCRIHGFTVYEKVQLGATSGLVSKYIPDEVIHTWAEVLFEGKWYALEGVILDNWYLAGLKKKFAEHKGAFCGYGLCVDDIDSLQIEWNGCDTYIQKAGIGQDFGVYDSPDDLLKEHVQLLCPLKKFAFEHYGRHVMNRNVNKIRYAK